MANTMRCAAANVRCTAAAYGLGWASKTPATRTAAKVLCTASSRSRANTASVSQAAASCLTRNTGGAHGRTHEGVPRTVDQHPHGRCVGGSVETDLERHRRRLQHAQQGHSQRFCGGVHASRCQHGLQGVKQGPTTSGWSCRGREVRAAPARKQEEDDKEGGPQTCVRRWLAGGQSVIVTHAMGRTGTAPRRSSSRRSCRSAEAGSCAAVSKAISAWRYAPTHPQHVDRGHLPRSSTRR